jgi:hypothetical protein
MKKGIVPLAVLLYLHCASALWAQAFQNLDFESATVSNIPADTAEYVSVSDALPRWSAYIGTNLLTQVGHNVITLGAANVGVWGPDYGFGIQPLQGSYSAIIQAGGFNSVEEPLGSEGGSATIAQMGLIPSSAKSIQFEGTLGLGTAGATFTNTFVFAVGGQSLPVVPLGGDLYGCDISAFTGSVQNISFTMNDDFGNALMLIDAISFSTESIPEPSTLNLVMVSIAALGLWHFARLGIRRTATLSRR